MMVLLALLLFSHRVAAAAQVEEPLETHQALQADHALERARRAQRDFENLRRRHLPRALGWGGSACDARVGRMCWVHAAVLGWTPREEAPAIIEARDSLIARLVEAAADAPGNPWILGQRVWYLTEADRIPEALVLAERCGGVPSWWCSALEGLVLHLQGWYPEAARAFDRALGAMPPEEALRWEDPAPLLDGDGADLLRHASEGSPEERDVFIHRLWNLADPLFLVPGNDRRTEHLARHTLVHVFSDAVTPHGIRWGNDMGELLLRYGWERGWERVPPYPGEMAASSRIVGYEHPDGRHFFPPAEILADPASARSEPWAPTASPDMRSAYAPEYAPVLLPMPSRLLILTRGDRALVAATFQLPRDTTYRGRKGIRAPHLPVEALRGWPLQAGLFLTDANGAPLYAGRKGGASEGVLTLEVPAGDYHASVEVIDPGAGRAGRFRNGLRVRNMPPDVPVLSGLLPVEGGKVPRTTQEALGRLRIDDQIEVGEPLVVGWELWGLGWREEVVRYRLSLEPADTGFLERFRRLFGGVRRFPVLEWEEPGPDRPGPAFQGVSLDLPAQEPGEYVLTLEVSLRGRESMVSRRRLRLR
jgi:hypothetical protein